MYKKNLTVIFLITLMAVMGVASITPAFPQIIRYFDITPTQVTVLITVFTLPGIFLSPIIGILADRTGRKIMLIPSLFLFGLSGAGCFLTKNWEVLVLLRFLQGIGAASLGSLNITLIGDLFEGEKRGAVMGYNASILSTGTALYPAVGGALAMTGWQFPFLLPLLAIPAGILAIFWLKNPEPKKNMNFKEYMARTWKNINRKTVWGLFIINILLFVVLYGSFLSFLPQLLEERFQFTSLEIGLYMSGFSVVTAITASQKKRINKILKEKTQLNISFILYFLAMLLISVAMKKWQLYLPLLLSGMGHGMLIPGLQTMLVGLAPLNERAGFMSINSMILRIGQTIGPIIIGMFYILEGVRTAFLGGALMALLMLTVSVLMVKTPRIHGKKVIRNNIR